MKKVIAIVLAIVMLFSLAACSEKSQFVGTWVGKDSTGSDVTWVFKSNGKGVNNADELIEWEPVNKNKIAITWNGGAFGGSGTLENGVLTICSAKVGSPHYLRKQ